MCDLESPKSEKGHEKPSAKQSSIREGNNFLVTSLAAHPAYDMIPWRVTASC